MIFDANIFALRIKIFQNLHKITFFAKNLILLNACLTMTPTQLLLAANIQPYQARISIKYQKNSSKKHFFDTIPGIILKIMRITTLNARFTQVTTSVVQCDSLGHQDCKKNQISCIKPFNDANPLGKISFVS